MKRFLFDHSLSIALGAGFFLSTYLSSVVERGGWWYDAWMMVGGSFGGSFIIVVLGRPLWEKGSDPTKPPPGKSVP